MSQLLRYGGVGHGGRKEQLVAERKMGKKE